MYVIHIGSYILQCLVTFIDILNIIDDFLHFIILNSSWTLIFNFCTTKFLNFKKFWTFFLFHIFDTVIIFDVVGICTPMSKNFFWEKSQKCIVQSWNDSFETGLLDSFLVKLPVWIIPTQQTQYEYSKHIYRHQ